MSFEQGWIPIESDPTNLTQIVRNLGVQGIEIVELFSLDQSSIEEIIPTYLIVGFLFCFRYQPNSPRARRGRKSQNFSSPTREREAFNSIEENVYFPRQIIPNACASYALLSILLNHSDGIDIGAELSELKDFSNDFSPIDKGLAISNCEYIRRAHCSLSLEDVPADLQFDTSSFDAPLSPLGNNLYHYVAYLRTNSLIVELDGIEREPVLLGKDNSSVGWIRTVLDRISDRIKDSSSDMDFSLLAVGGSRKNDILQTIEELKIKIADSPTNIRRSEIERQIEKYEEKLEDLRKNDDVAEREAVWRSWEYELFIFRFLESLFNKEAESSDGDGTSNPTNIVCKYILDFENGNET